MRIGVIFSDKDLQSLKSRRLDAVAIAPACPIDENEVAKAFQVRTFNLNDLIGKGEMAPLSRDCARFIRVALQGIALPDEAQASQNDIYQYHLRKQYLFHIALKRFLESDNIGRPDMATLVFPFASMVRYESPMRPELNKFFNDFRTLGYLAKKLSDKRGVRVEFTDQRLPMLTRIRDFFALPLRQALLQAYALLKLVEKIRAAGARKFPDSGVVGIVVRTDSEVVSATALIDTLNSAGIKTLIIQDELLASETTAIRLKAVGLSYVPVGSAMGLRGLLVAFPFAARRDRMRIAASIADNLDREVSFMDVPAARWASWMSDRLFDFFLLQRHFAREMGSLIQVRNVKLLITFAYVDQWGPVIQKAGEAAGIRTICVQNAAQDPEEYPQLAWSDHYCVESLYLKNRLVALGYPAGQITATGLPHYTTGAKSQAALISTSGKPAVLLVTQPIYTGYYIELFKWLAPFCARNGCELHVKYHPRQTGDEYADVLANVSRICPVTVFHRESLDDALKEARICISIVSAAIIKAINIGVPTISFLPKSEKYLDLYYCSNENLFVADTLCDLDNILRWAIGDFPDFWSAFKRRRQNYLDNHLATEPSGDSALNILGVINAHLS